MQMMLAFYFSGLWEVNAAASFTDLWPGECHLVPPMFMQQNQFKRCALLCNAQFCELFAAAANTPSSHYKQESHVICLINRSSVTDWGDHNFQENNPCHSMDK